MHYNGKVITIIQSLSIFHFLQVFSILYEIKLERKIDVEKNDRFK